MPHYFPTHSSIHDCHPPLRRLAIIAVGLGVTLSPTVAQPPQLSIVAMQGAQIVGLAENEWLSGWDFAKGINQQGDVVFSGSVIRTDSKGNHHRAGKGIWSGKPGALRLVARAGQPLPGNEASLVYSELLAPLEFNNQGDIAFLARIGPNTNTHQSTALFSGKPGNLRMIAKDGDSAPGFEDSNGRLAFNTNFYLSNRSRLSLGDNGTLAWSAEVQAPYAITQSLWRTKGGTTEHIWPDSDRVTMEQFNGISTGSDGSVAFTSFGPNSTLYYWNDSELTQIVRAASKVGDSNTLWSRLGGPFHQRDGGLVFAAQTRRSGERRSDRSIWQWKKNTLRQIVVTPTPLITDQLVSASNSLNPIPGINLVTYTACGMHPINPGRQCENYIFVDDGIESKVVAFEGMQFPGEPEGSEIVLNGIPGLLDRSLLANERGTMVAHLGKRKDDGQVIQGIYRVDSSDYSPIIEEGDVVNLGSEGEGTAIKFHLYTEVSPKTPLRSLNDNNQLLFWITTEEHRDALVVASLSRRSAPSITQTPHGVSLQWDGNGTLETAPEVGGPWVKADSQALLQDINAGNPMQFFRTRIP